MKKYLFFLLCPLFLLAADCNDSEVQPVETGTLELNFKPAFGTDPLVMYARAYPYEAGVKVKWQLFRFYLSDISIDHKDKAMQAGKTIIKDIELIDFEAIQSDLQVKDGITITFDKVPVDDYQAILFGVGVSKKLNETNPGFYAPGHPLGDNYWSAALGYVFTKIEGNADKDGDDNFESKLTFHAGGDPYYRKVNFEKDFTIKPNETTRLNFEVDLRAVLVRNQNDFLDFRKVTIDHTTKPEIATFISDNLVNAITLQ